MNSSLPVRKDIPEEDDYDEDDEVKRAILEAETNEVWRPENAKAVEHEAFIACRALEHVYNLPADTAPGAFKYAVRYQPE